MWFDKAKRRFGPLDLLSVPDSVIKDDNDKFVLSLGVS